MITLSRLKVEAKTGGNRSAVIWRRAVTLKMSAMGSQGA
jgi:hypothetical protein